MKFVVALTGASGAIYAQRLLTHLVRTEAELFVTMSAPAARVIQEELGLKLDPHAPALDELVPGLAARARYCDSRDVGAPIASGSFRHDGMVIVPCSGGTLGRIASGASTDLTSRAADVCLKERRKLILVTRETPLNLIHLRNLVTLTEAGALVLPASPSFYTRPQTVEQLVDTVVARVLDQLGVENSMPRWA